MCSPSHRLGRTGLPCPVCGEEIVGMAHLDFINDEDGGEFRLSCSRDDDAHEAGVQYHMPLWSHRDIAPAVEHISEKSWATPAKLIAVVLPLDPTIAETDLAAFCAALPVSEEAMDDSETFPAVTPRTMMFRGRLANIGRQAIVFHLDRATKDRAQDPVGSLRIANDIRRRAGWTWADVIQPPAEIRRDAA